MEALLDIPGVAGLGEVMDFNAVAAGDERMLSVIEAAANHGVFLDGHVSALTGRRLQTFRAMGIDSDHTVPSAEKLREELALGFTVQVQECMLNREIVQAMNAAPVQDRHLPGNGRCSPPPADASGLELCGGTGHRVGS